MADDRDRDAGGSGARRALPGEGTGMSGVEGLAEQLAVAVKENERLRERVASLVRCHGKRVEMALPKADEITFADDHGGPPENPIRRRWTLYRCPVHGLIESPTWHEDEISEDSGYYCPLNLTGKAEAMHDGITDEVCGKDVSGPIEVVSALEDA